MDFVALDFETTGYEDGNVNEPWQLGIAVVEAGRIVFTKEWFFAVSRPFAPLSGRDEGTLLESYEEWAKYLTGRRLVAHNISTERTILTRTAPLTRWGPWADTLKLCKAHYPKMPSYALGDLCAAFGLIPQLDGRTWHDALYDAVACARLALFLS